MSISGAEELSSRNYISVAVLIYDHMFRDDDALSIYSKQ